MPHPKGKAEDAQAAAEGKSKIVFERPESSERTQFGDSVDGYGFGVLLNYWDYRAFMELDGCAQVLIPLRDLAFEDVARVQTRLSRAGLRERIGRERLRVVLWDDGASVHVVGEQGAVEIVGRAIREAIDEGQP